jgi:alkylation response protein AidB-like acyl-CoA dehydrogenase
MDIKWLVNGKSQLVDSLDPVRREYVARIGELAREKFVPRADGYDRAAAFPAEDFEDLFRAGLNAPCVPESYGGLGLGPGRHTYALWMMTKDLARANMSLARCWEGHVNSQVLISALGDDKQKERWFKGIVDRGDVWVAWSGEPQAKVPGQASSFGTHLQKVNGGYVLSGKKAYATSAGHARRAILLVNAAGPGGARHASGSSDQLLLLACDLGDPGVTFDSSWWNPIGMRATVSYLVRFDDVFIAAEDVIGRPGEYLNEAWQTRFSPHYASTFLGGAEAAYDYALESIKEQKREDDPYVSHRIGHMSLDVETAHLWLKNVADLWDAGRTDEAKVAGIRARYLVEYLAMEVLDHCIRSCGARSLVKPSPVERIYRDLSIYVRHDNSDQILATIGSQVLGRDYDGSFFRWGVNGAPGLRNGSRP